MALRLPFGGAPEGDDQPRRPRLEPSPRRGRPALVLRALIAFVVAPIILGAIVLLVLTNTPWGNERVRRVLVSQANDRVQGSVTIGTLRGGLLSNATLTDVRVVDSARRPMFTARRVQVRYALWPALQGRVVLRSLALDTAVIVMDRRPGARWNFQSLLPRRAGPRDTTARRAPPELSNVTLRHSTLLYRRPWRPDSTLAPAEQRAAVERTLAATARSRTEAVPGGYQRVLEYRNIDASIPSIVLPRGSEPGAVRIASLSMLAQPYRPPAIDVRRLAGTLYTSRDSLWWRGARMTLPGSQVSGDGRIGFRRAGFRLDLTGAPLALADLRWLSPRVPAEGGGRLRYTMRTHGDTSEFALADADVRIREATVVGSAAITRVTPKGGKSALTVRGIDLTVSRLATSLIQELAPEVKLPRRGVLNGRVAVRGTPNALALDADMRFADVQAGESHVRARGGIGTEGGLRANELRVELLPLRVASVAGPGGRLPVGGTVTGDATVSGSVASGWQVRGDLTHLENGDRSRVSGSGSYRAAGRRIAADATLQPVSLATIGRFVPSAGLRGGVTGRVHAEGTTRDLRLSGALRSTTGGGAIAGRGFVAPDGSRTRYDISVALDALDARAFSRRAPSTRLTGTISARGAGTRPATANAVVAANLTGSRYDTFSVDRLRTRLALANGLLRVDTLDAAASGARAQAAGTLGLVRGRDGALQFAATVDSLGALRRWLGSSDTTMVAAPAARQAALYATARADSARRAEAVRIERLALGLPAGDALLVDTLPGIRRDSMSGSLRAAGTLTGSIPALGVNAQVEGRDLVARGSAIGRLSATLSSANVRSSNRSVVFRGDAETLQLAGYGFEAVEAGGTYAGRRLSGDLRIRQDARTAYAALGSWAHPASGVHDVRLDSLRAQFDTLAWRLAHGAGVRVSGGDITIDSVDLRSSAGGRLFATGVVPKSAPVRLDVAAENVRVATVLQALQKDAAGDGVLGAALHVEGTRRAPVMTGRAALREASVGGTRAPDADVTLAYRGGRLAVDALARDSVGRRVLTATATLPLDLALEKVSGSRKVAGALVADVVVDSLSLAALPLQSRAVEEVRGLVYGAARVRGTWREPVYGGRGALREGGMLVSSTGMRLAGAVADLRLTGDTLRLDSLVATAGGTLRAAGTVDIRDRAHPMVQLTAMGTNLRVMDATRGLVDVDGEIIAAGPLDSVRVTGRAEMLRGFLALKQFNKKLLRVKAPGSLSFFAVYDTTRPAMDRARAATELARKRRVGIVADLSLVVDRGNYYRNRPDANTEFYTGEGEEVRAHIDTRAGDTWALGFVRIGEGVAIFRAAPFEPARGTLTFLPWTGSPGMIEQVGERIVWEPGRGFFPVQLLTGGTSKAPALGLESGTLFPIRGRELSSYLTIGRERLSLLQQSGSSLSGSEAWSGQLSGETGALARRQQAATALGVVLHDIGTGATKEFGLDAFSVSPADVPTELVFGKTGGVRGALIEGGRYVTPDRYIAGQMRLTTGIPGLRLQQRFGTTYRLDMGVAPRFLFRDPEELGITHPTVRSGVFGAFLTRYWDW
ncbi:MAG: hypothetical protein JWL60_2042 [Gemmatimonadetes bacterium]|nr:hypothetical protein [Gemmatimonadota bacterium]